MMAPTSPPSPAPDTVKGWGNFFHLLNSKSEQGQLITIELSVLLTSVFLVLLFIHGNLRRRFHVRPWLDTLMRGVYILTPVLITYIIGLMRNAYNAYALFPVWALVLIYIYGGVDSITACDLRDNEKALQYALHMLPLFFWAFWLGFGRVHLTGSLLLLLFLASWNTKETLQALYRASQTKGLPRYIGFMVDYMREGRAVSSDAELLDPVSMKGYTFLVYDNDDGVTVTTQDVWGCEGALFHGPTSRTQPLKDLTLSFAWSLLLLRRFAGFTLHETSNPNMLFFVKQGLLNPLDLQRVERLFHIIEVELSFVSDFFYTKLCVITSKRSVYKLRRLFCVPFFLWFAFVTLARQKASLFHLGLPPYHQHSLEIILTRIVLITIAVLEIWQTCMYFLSYWRVLVLVCQYVHEQKTSQPSSWSMIKPEKLILRIWRIKNILLEAKYIGLFLRPWKREIGQYSFLRNYDMVPKLRFLLNKTLYHFVEVPRVGQVGGFNVTLSIDVKKEIASSIMNITSQNPLSPGEVTLRRNGVFRERPKWEVGAEVILVWHIATSACDYFCMPSKESGEFEYHNVATQISKYCAYLVTFAPELLPDHPYNKIVFDRAVEDAISLFEGKDMDQRYNMLWLDEQITDQARGDARNVVVNGGVLARELRDHVLGHANKGWRVLAEFWAELLLYLSLSDNTTAHGVHLARGGEFITHLWALLTHAGIVAPHHAFPADADIETR